MEDSKDKSASIPEVDDLRHETINKDAKQGQEINTTNISNDDSQQGDIIELEKNEQMIQGIIVTESETKDNPSTEKDYSIFTAWQKRFIVFAATMGAFFSPFTTQIYFPALTSIAKDLHVSNSKINLTMTTYMVRYPFPV